MSESSRKTYRPWEHQRYRQEAHSPEAKLPEGDLVFFVLDTVSKLDLSRFYALYEEETRGAPPFDPAMMVCLLLYAYCVGVFSSRKIAPLNLSLFVEDQNGPGIGQTLPFSLCSRPLGLMPLVRSVPPARTHSADESSGGIERSPRILGDLFC